MGLDKLKRKKQKFDKVRYELNSMDLSPLVGGKVKITGSCVKWYKKHADEIGIPHSEMEAIAKKPIGTITKVRYDDEDGFTITVDFGGFTKLLGIQDLREV